jgi:hypothetical protein
MTADIAVSMPEMGSVFRQQLRDLAESSMIKAEVAEERTLYLAAAGTYLPETNKPDYAV